MCSVCVCLAVIVLNGCHIVVLRPVREGVWPESLVPHYLTAVSQLLSCSIGATLFFSSLICDTFHLPAQHTSASSPEVSNVPKMSLYYFLLAKTKFVPICKADSVL